MLRVVSSDEATVRLLDGVEPGTSKPPVEMRPHLDGSVPLPKSMQALGCEALEAAEVSAAAGRDRTSAAKSMAKLGVDFYREENSSSQNPLRRSRPRESMFARALDLHVPKNMFRRQQTESSIPVPNAA